MNEDNKIDDAIREAYLRLREKTEYEKLFMDFYLFDMVGDYKNADKAYVKLRDYIKSGKVLSDISKMQVEGILTFRKGNGEKVLILDEVDVDE